MIAALSDRDDRNSESLELLPSFNGRITTGTGRTPLRNAATAQRPACYDTEHRYAHLALTLESALKASIWKHSFTQDVAAYSLGSSKINRQSASYAFGSANSRGTDDKTSIAMVIRNSAPFLVIKTAYHLTRPSFRRQSLIKYRPKH